MLDQRAGGLPPAAIYIVREEIAGAFRDKLRVSIIHRGQLYWRPYDSRLTITHTHMELGYSNSQSFRVTAST
jgi:hypothetical protein